MPSSYLEGACHCNQEVTEGVADEWIGLESNGSLREIEEDM